MLESRYSCAQVSAFSKAALDVNYVTIENYLETWALLGCQTAALAVAAGQQQENNFKVKKKPFSLQILGQETVSKVSSVSLSCHPFFIVQRRNQ